MISLVVALILGSAERCSPDGRICAAFTPVDDTRSFVETRLLRARHEILIAAYHLNDPTILGALREVIERGVRVTIVADAVRAVTLERTLREELGSSAEAVELLGSPALRGSRASMHAKIVVIDRRTTILGSANYTPMGFVLGYESLFGFEDEVIAEQSALFLEHLGRTAREFCDAFAVDPHRCGKSGAILRYPMNVFARTGTLPEPTHPVRWIDTLRFQNPCSDLARGHPLVTSRMSRPSAPACFGPLGPTMGHYLARVAENEASLANGLDNARRRQTDIDLVFGPTESARQRVLDLLKHARGGTIVSSLMYVTDRQIGTAIRALEERGDEVLFLLDPRQEDLTKNVALQRSQSAIFVDPVPGLGGMNHGRMALAINESRELESYFGSANWSSGAIENNQEVFAFTRNEVVATFIGSQIELQLREHVSPKRSELIIDRLRKALPCLDMLSGRAQTCTLRTTRESWQVPPTSAVYVSGELVQPMPSGARPFLFVEGLEGQEMAQIPGFPQRYTGRASGPFQSSLKFKFGFGRTATTAVTEEEWRSITTPNRRLIRLGPIPLRP